MIYQIKCDDNILYDIREKEFFVEDPTLSLEINKVGTLNLYIYPDHPYFDRLNKITSKIEAYRNGKTIFRGRIINDSQSIYNCKNIECESTLAFLNDTIAKPRIFQGTPQELFTFLIENHNSQVSIDKQFKIGNITVTDSNDYIRRSWDTHTKTLDLINSKCIDSLGGYIVERYEEDATYLDWLADIDKISNQTIEFGENLIDIFTNNDASNIFSVVVPLGANLEQEDGTFKRLTIDSVNNDIDYLVNNLTMQKYGWIVAPLEKTTWDDVTLPETLKSKGEKFLTENCGLVSSTIELTALDLSSCDINIEEFFIYEKVNIYSKPHNFNASYLLKSIIIPFNRPQDIKITLGETKTTITGINLGNKQEIDNIINRVGTIEADYITNKELPNIIDESIKDSSIIKQLPDEIMLSVQEEYTKIESKVNQNAITSNNNYQDLVNKLNDKASQDSITTITNKIEDVITSTDRTTTAIEEIKINGVTQVKTENNLIFNKDGLLLDETGAPVKNQMNTYGIEIVDKTGSSLNTQFFSGYVSQELVDKNPQLAQFLGQTITYTNDIYARNFIKMENGRWENVEHSKWGKGIGCFIGGGS